MVEQALILVGGRASRLKAGGISVPLSKAFMAVASEPLLYWNLRNLYAAGIRRLIIAADEIRFLHAAQAVIRNHPCKFEDVQYFRDEGNGVHGIPYELQYLLDERYIFECGHNLQPSEHYKRLASASAGANDITVFSAYRPHPQNQRQPVTICGKKVLRLQTNGGWVIAHPIVAHKDYANRLLGLGFNIETIIATYTMEGSLYCIRSSFPPEYDLAVEMTAAHHIYEQYVASIATI